MDGDDMTSDDRRSRLVVYLRALARDPVIAAAAVFLLLLVLAAVGSSFVFPHDPTTQSLQARNLPPLSSPPDGGFVHVFGTDPLGRDVFARLLDATKVSVSVGFLGVVVSGVVGVTLGLVAGYYRGRVDDTIMRLVDLQMGIPFLLLALVVLFIFGGGFVNVVIVLAVARWPIYARVTRGMALSLRSEVFVDAARALGASDVRIILRHVLPNLASPIIVLGTLEVARLILAEATLSFLGLGIQPPDASWGLMIAQGREFLSAAPWNVYMPGLFIFGTALSLNLVSTWLRAITDPVQRDTWLRESKRANVLDDVEQAPLGV